MYLCCLVCGLSGRGIRQIVDNAVLSVQERKNQPQKACVFPPRKRKRMEEARERGERRVSPESALLTRPWSLFPFFPSSVSHLEILMSQRRQICKTSDTLHCTAMSGDWSQVLGNLNIKQPLTNSRLTVALSSSYLQTLEVMLGTMWLFLYQTHTSSLDTHTPTHTLIRLQISPWDALCILTVAWEEIPQKFISLQIYYHFAIILMRTLPLCDVLCLLPIKDKI